jgi:asparagine synthase (glutamine-hydrolysing)
MCGFTGFFNFPNLENSKSITNFINIIKNRGPDSQNFLNYNNLHLIFARLSIVDLSDNAMQPIISRSNNMIMLFNGEIYNYKSLKKRLLDINKIEQECNSDTKILIESFDQFGLEILNDIRGMFSIVLFDKKKNLLFFINDRFGEKPLYYSYSDKNLFFSSDIKSFNFKKRNINKKILNKYFSNNYIGYPHTIWEDVNKISPSTIISFKIDFINNKVSEPVFKKYWSPHKKINITKDDLDSVTDKLDNLLSETIENQLSADVEVGTFLSGGIDSSLITAIAQKVSNKKISSFSIGFEDVNLDESVFAEKIATHLDTNHHCRILKMEDISEIFNSLTNIYGEPYSDSSQIPTVLLSKFTSKYVKVVLTGDGGDELFGGYDRYSFVNNVWSYIDFLPLSLRKYFSKFLEYTSPLSYSFICKIIKLTFSKYKNTKFIESKLRNLVMSLDSSNPIIFAKKISSHFHEGYPLLSKFQSTKNLYNYEFKDSDNIAESIMINDTEDYLPNDLLVKTDRASMHYGLEARMPFLDHSIYEFSKSLPLNYKISKNSSKIILKKLLKRYVPENLFERPKQGFLVPLKEVINHEIIQVEKLLNEENILKHQILDFEKVQNELNSFKNSSNYNQYNLWDVIILQLWLKDFNKKVEI